MDFFKFITYLTLGILSIVLFVPIVIFLLVFLAVAAILQVLFGFNLLRVVKWNRTPGAAASPETPDDVPASQAIIDVEAVELPPRPLDKE